MIMNKILTCVIAAWMVATVSLPASGGEYRFSHISIDNGLSKNTVHDFVQDKDGYIWIATFNGLNRFDGYSVKVFKNDPDQDMSIISNLVTSIDYDGDKCIWAGTSNGLSIYDKDRQIFENNLESVSIDALKLLDKNTALVATPDSLIVYDKIHGTSHNIKHQGKDIKAYVLSRGERGTYIGTWNDGLLVYSEEERAVALVSVLTQRLKINCIHCIEDNVWVGTEGGGLYCINESSDKISHYTKEAGHIIDDTVRSLQSDNNGNLWVGTLNGLTILNEGNQVSENLKHNSFVPGSLSHDSIRTIFVDNQEGVWIGTYYGGVNYWHPMYARFRHIRRLPDKSSLNDNVTSCIVEDNNGNIWIGTNKGGLNRIHSDGKFSYYSLPIANDVKSIYIDEDKSTLYVGGHGTGLNVMSIESGKAHHVSGSPSDIYSLLKKDERSIWVGSFNGLYIYDIPSQEMIKVTNTEVAEIRILSLFSDGNTLWIGAEEGIFVYDILSKNMITGIQDKLKPISYVHSFLKTSGDELWIASINGLFRWDGEKLTGFTDNDGLSSNAIHGMEEDSFGRIWLSTDNGLNCFNPESGTIKSYFVSDGLQSNEFNAYSHCLLSNGQMMFGGIGGITMFKPETLKKNMWAEKPMITRLESAGKEINVSKDIVLTHESNSLTITFSVPNYSSWGNNTFAYKLDGFDQDWVQTSTYRTVSYSNIPKGKYKFLLKAANGDGIWNNEVEVINITVLPPWYGTICAQLAFAIILIVFIWILLKSYIDRKNLKNRLELDKQEKEHRDEMNQMKTRFIINTSHELRTPLTLILAPLAEMLARSTDIWMNKQIKGIERNAKKILRLTNQLIDFKHIDSGTMQLNVRKENVSKIVSDNFSFYKNLAHMKHIRYSMSSDIDNQLLYVDAEYLEIVINSLLSNAFKYTDKGYISLNITLIEEHLRLEVTDSGIGINAEREDNSDFSIQLIKKLMELHHGRLDFSSIEGEGSRFTADFPQSLDAYAEDELKDNLSPLTNNPDDTDDEDNNVDQKPEVLYGKILIVENDHELSRIIERRLSKVFEVVTAVNGEEAQMAIDSQDFDLVITEEVMPVIGGVKLCQNLKQNFRTSQIPVFIITAKTNTEDHMDFLLAGADDYIIKPFSLRILLNKAKNIIRLRRRTLENYTKTIAIVPEKIALTSRDEEFMNKIKNVVEQHLSDPDFTTEIFARHMNMSRANLHVKISTITGESALDYINKMRFAEACRLLKEGRHTIAEISDKVGFTSPSYFAARFKKFVGYTPTEYARM